MRGGREAYSPTKRKENMTDTLIENRYTEVEDASQVRAFYKKMWNAIAEIDEKLDAGSESAGKKKITNELVVASEAEWKPVSENIIEEMRKFETDEERTGVFYGLIRALSGAFKEDAEKLITAAFESAPKTEDNLTDEQKKALATERSELASQIKLTVQMAGTFGEFEEGNEWPLPKRRGAVGKRGKRALSFYDWSIDGVDQEGDANSVKGVAATLGFALQADFTKALKEQMVGDKKLDTTNPPEKFSVEINGKTVVAVRGTVEADPNEVPTNPSGAEDAAEEDVDDDEDEDEDEE